MLAFAGQGGLHWASTADRSANAQLFASKGQFDAAINEWKKLSADSPADGGIYNSIGELHLKRGATHEAVAAFLQSAHAFRAEGATLKAIATYKKVLKLDPSHYDVYRFLGDLNAERGLLSSAVQDYLTLGKHYLKERKTKEALDIYRMIVSQDPSNFDAQQRVAELCLQENMQDEATKVYLQLGRERSAQQRYSEAKEAYQSVLRIDPANSEAIQFIEHFEKVRRRSESGSQRRGIGRGGGRQKFGADGFAGRGQPEDRRAAYAGAEAILNQLLSKSPATLRSASCSRDCICSSGNCKLPSANIASGRRALRAQEYPQAEALIKEFLAVEPNSVPLLELYGELYHEQGDIQAAIQQYGKAVEVLLHHPEPGMPTLHEEIFEQDQELGSESPMVQRLTALMQGGAVEPEDVSVSPVPRPRNPSSKRPGSGGH